MIGVSVLAFGLGMALSLAAGLAAHAAQPARVTKDLAPLRDGPSANFDVLKKLPLGSALQISNTPKQGFYKARASDGIVGWIEASQVLAISPELAAKANAKRPAKRPTKTGQSEVLPEASATPEASEPVPETVDLDALEVSPAATSRPTPK